ncbi:hypothetical protein D3C81_1906480 [compost metagenome]
MAIAQGGQAVGAVVAGILGVADPDQGAVEQGDHQGHDLVSVEGGPGQVRVDLLAHLGQ